MTWVGGLSGAGWPVGIMVVGSMPGTDAGSYLISLLWVPISAQVRAVELNSKWVLKGDMTHLGGCRGRDVLRAQHSQRFLDKTGPGFFWSEP